MPKKKQLTQFDGAVDLSAFENKPISVSVNGIELPLKIGDKIVIEDKEKIVRTVSKMQISEDGHVIYCLEWFNGTDFKTDWVTTAELFYMWNNLNVKNSVVFSA